MLIKNFQIVADTKGLWENDVLVGEGAPGALIALS